MKLLKKYSKEINEETHLALTEILNQIKSLDEKKRDLLISVLCNKSLNYVYSHSVENEFEVLNNSEEEESINILYSLVQNTDMGLVVVGITAIMKSFSNETFDFINKSFDFDKYEKANKVKLSKFFYNTSENKHLAIELAIKKIKEQKENFNLETTCFDRWLIEKEYWIASSIAGVLKKDLEKHQMFSTMLSIILEKKTFNLLKPFIGLKKPEVLENNEHEEMSLKIMSKVYRQVKQEKKSSLYKVKEVLSIENGFVLATLEGNFLQHISLKLEHFNSSKYVYISFAYRYIKSELKEVNISDDDWIHTRNKNNLKLSISKDTSYSALEKVKYREGVYLAEANSFVLSDVKEWLRDYDENNLVGSVIHIEIASEHYSRRSELCYAVVQNISSDGDEMVINVLIASPARKELYYSRLKDQDLSTYKCLSKLEASLFYQDIAFIVSNRK